jgi:hypothetical protein
MLSFPVLSFPMQSVIMLSAVMLSVVAPLPSLASFTNWRARLCLVL